MHLSRGYPWILNLSDREINIIEKCLRDDELTDDDVVLADHVLNTIRRERNKATSRRKSTKSVTAAQLNSVDDEVSEEQ